MDREDMKHHMMILVTEGRLHLAPISEKPQRILDVGTGTGAPVTKLTFQHPRASQSLIVVFRYLGRADGLETSWFQLSCSEVSLTIAADQYPSAEVLGTGK